MAWEYFDLSKFGTSFGANMFAVATGTCVSRNLGRHYRPGLNLSFLD
jgi:hypothetical protein